MRTIRPISELGSRVPEAGKIRLGHQVATKNGMKRPAALETFRFTSPYADVIDQLAALYGGEPRVWEEPKAKHQSQFEVITEASTISILVPPGGLSQHYELWSGSGCVRRCNGILCEVPSKAPDEDVTSVPCLCTENQEMECVPKTRLTVALPDVVFRGVWLLESSSWNAAEELVGMEAMLQEIQQVTTITQAELHLQHRTSKRGGQTKQFVVPVLTIPHTPAELAAGGGQLRPARGLSGARAALNPGDAALPRPGGPDHVALIGEDDDVAEAEMIPSAEDIAEQAIDLANQLVLDPHGFLTGLCRGISGRHRGSDEDHATAPEQLTDDELLAAAGFLADVKADRIEVTGINTEGRLVVKQRR